MNFNPACGIHPVLGQSGFDTITCACNWGRIFGAAVCLIMALISIPFAFLTGSRAAMAGVGVSLGIAVAYWLWGNCSSRSATSTSCRPNWPPGLPDILFALAGLYLLTRLKT